MGLLRGDRIVSIDGVLANDSPRLGYRTDDAFLPDPPVRPMLGTEGEVTRLRIERRPGSYTDLEIPMTLYSAWDAAKASVRVIEQDGKRIGLIHFWLIHMTGPDELLKESLEGKLADCDALVLDLRGRGGNGFMVARHASSISAEDLPIQNNVKDYKWRLPIGLAKKGRVKNYC